MNHNYYQFVETPETRIYYRKMVPPEPKAIVIVSHGYGEHSGFYSEFMEFLSTYGYATYALDHRGHGLSQEERGHLEKFEYFITDMDFFVEAIQSFHPDLPIFIFGHSMGGLIAFIYGLVHGEKIKGQVFSGAALGRPKGTRLIPGFVFKTAKKHFSRFKIYPVLRNRATRNKKIRKYSDHDKLVLKYATAGFFCEFIYRGIDFAQRNASKYNLPCLILHGTSDKIVPYKYSPQIFRKISSIDKELKLYKGLYHELIQEPEREEVLNDILGWLQKRVN